MTRQQRVARGPDGSWRVDVTAGVPDARPAGCRRAALGLGGLLLLVLILGCRDRRRHHHHPDHRRQRRALCRVCGARRWGGIRGTSLRLRHSGGVEEQLIADCEGASPPRGHAADHVRSFEIKAAYECLR